MTTAIRLTLTANGEQIEGDGIADGESGFIDCLAFTDGITTDQAPTGRSFGRRHYAPIVVRKRIDRTSPRLLGALSQNEPVEAVLRFYRPTTELGLEHFFTVAVTGGRIVSIERSWAANEPSEAEDVAIAPSAIIWTFEPDGTTFESRPRSVV
jgi:type VI secretion system secreted protein Hcp